MFKNKMFKNIKLVFSIIIVLLVVFLNFNFAHIAKAEATPTGTILINGGATITNNKNVTLTLSATDGISPVNEMQFNNGTGPYSAFEPYSTTKAWILSSSGDGVKNVRVKFKDQAGNITATGILATITLDTTAPIVTLNGQATVNLNVGDTYTELGATTDDGSIVVTNGTVDINTAGTYIITYNVTDVAGNVATSVVRTVNISAIPIETCSDGIQNQDETGVDTGGVCTLPPAPILGCMDNAYDNYNPTATVDDGSCANVPAPTCSDGIQNQDETGVDTGGVCTVIVTPIVITPVHTSGGYLYGCKDPKATNYNPNSASKPSLCIYPVVGKVLGAEKFNFTLPLKKGSKGDEVFELQKFLNNDGFILRATRAGSPENETKYFGPFTKAAVIKFQLAKNLKGDGVVGPLTRAELNK